MSKHFLQGWIVFIMSSLGGYWLYKQTSFSTESIKFLTDLSLDSVLLMYAVLLPLFFVPLSSIYSWFAKIVVACYSCFHAYLGPIILERHGIMEYSFDFVFFIGQFIFLWFAIHSNGKGWILLYIVLTILHSIIIY